MTASLHLAGPDDTDRVMSLVRSHHADAALELSEEMRRDGVEPLLAGSALGAIYLVGPRSAPAGYIALTFSWSIAHGGMTATIDEFFMRPPVRGRGLGSEALTALRPVLVEVGLRALYLDLRLPTDRAQSLAGKWGFHTEHDTERLIWTP
ncbi:MAG: GNAT family N-acetyltransferase [Pseudomonadota bacterium]